MKKTIGTVEIAQRKFKIDFKKVKTVKDIILLLETFEITIDWYQDKCPDKFKEIYDKGFLKEINN